MPRVGIERKIKMMDEVAKMIAENPTIKTSEIKRKLGYKPNTNSKTLDFLKTETFKKLIEHRQLTDLFQSLGVQATYLNLKPLASIATAEVFERLLEDERRAEIPDRVLLEFLIRYARIEGEVKKVIPTKRDKSPDDIFEDMKKAVSDPKMLGKSFAKKNRPN